MYNIIYDKKILFEDGTIFDVAEYPIETEPSIFAKRAYLKGESREVIRVTVNADYNLVNEKFINNTNWAVRQFDVSSDGEILDTYNDYDKSDYCVTGDIVDHRDGRITVYMGKKTEKEILQEAFDEAVLLLTEV